MDEFGKRLKEERERLGLSQSKFAEACGVKKTAQYTYEKGTRRPDYGYLEAAERLGVDTLYLMTGTRKGNDLAYTRAYKRILLTVEMFLGLNEEQLERIAAMAVQLVRPIDEIGADAYNKVLSEYNLAVMNWLKTSTKPDACIDMEMLTKTLAEIEITATKTGRTIPPEKKAAIAIMLYRAFRASGKIDPKMVEDAVSVAS
ncbi:helix-turn-helix domain-containing protein [Methylocaldum szegediense]|uniref:helix-turn-helix domain-containing protein n=1 Tax=Methylocaldum szegediense TaxID=73780 RepID=UPI000424E103|nr:helix-turn-helix transcriptional regulator [Methylocaldum szegediense]